MAITPKTKQWIERLPMAKVETEDIEKLQQIIIHFSNRNVENIQIYEVAQVLKNNDLNINYNANIFKGLLKLQELKSR